MKYFFVIFAIVIIIVSVINGKKKIRQNEIKYQTRRIGDNSSMWCEQCSQAIGELHKHEYGVVDDEIKEGYKDFQCGARLYISICETTEKFEYSYSLRGYGNVKHINYTANLECCDCKYKSQRKAVDELFNKTK